MDPYYFYPPNQSHLGEKLTRNENGDLVRVWQGGKKIAYEDQPALEYWEKHYNNCMILRALLANAQNPTDRQRFAEELERGEAKQKHWERHPNWSVEEATRIAERVKANKPNFSTSEVGLTIANRWRVAKDKSADTEVTIDVYLATHVVTTFKKGKSGKVRSPRKR